MDILDDMGVSKLSAKVFLKVNYSFNTSFLDKKFISKLLKGIVYTIFFIQHYISFGIRGLQKLNY